jgi:hypothetical protein
MFSVDGHSPQQPMVTPMSAAAARLASEPARRVDNYVPVGGEQAAGQGAAPLPGHSPSTAVNGDNHAAQPVSPGSAAAAERQGESAGKRDGRFSGVRSENELSEEERKQVEELKKRDQEVKTHEAAHKAAGGQYVRGAASYTYQSGPDGRRYAIGGEVKIDSGKVEGDPQKTIEKGETIRRAAMAPAEPSSQDRQVAAKAAQMVAEARMEQSGERMEDGEDGEEGESQTIADGRNEQQRADLSAAESAAGDRPAKPDGGVLTGSEGEQAQSTNFGQRRGGSAYFATRDAARETNLLVNLYA